ncbi:hypothetical protein HNQ07_004762 [Deinococcus metalli]|uniref:Uncharacterized protein n=1 Tax=Deinococcus metalli TaxID=1141878 RepID=A0A7W8KJE9_9DEIO|nr:hypothetical protein [Deinococcus metalli]MBB5379247.1 hypothetical protein [Deinococcus metalli]GHF65704.1 hypothetical protein GCM10017781_46780 [Deinococcus metalli]
MTPRVRRWLLSGLGFLCTAAAAVTPTAPVQPGQVWTLSATTADGERFRTTLRVDTTPPTGTPATYRADRGALILDPARGTLIALDLLDARQGGVGLACVVEGPLDALEVEGVLASGTLADLPARLETALAVIGVAHTPADRAAAVQELKLGTCTLTHAP